MTEPIRQYTLREAATTLRVSLRTVHRLVSRRQLRVTRIGRRTLIRENELVRFVDKSTT